MSRREERRRSLNEKKRLLKDADISIKNNSIALVVLKSEVNGGSLYEINPREVEEVTFEDLQSIVKKQRKLFEDYFVLITEVYSETVDNLTVNDVLTALGLAKLVEKDDEEIPDDFYFDDILSNDCDLNEFKEELDNMKKAVACRLSERAVYLYKERKFADSIKMKLIEDKIGEKYVFEDVDRSERVIGSDVEEF